MANSVRTIAHSTLKADVVVLGGGGAGLPAAVTAAENGARNVILLEKRKTPGGNAFFAGGMLAAGSSLQRRLGADVTPDNIFRGVMAYGHWKLDAQLIRALVDKTSDNIAWLEKKGLSFTRLVPFSSQSLLTYHAIGGAEGTGARFVKTLIENCRELGVRILCETTTEKILSDNEGTVSGVLATTKSGSVTIRAKSIILATGGMLGNERLLQRFDPSYRESDSHILGVRNTGDGFLLATAIGGATDGLITLEREGPDFRWSKRVALLARKPQVIWVNVLGDRFTDESAGSVSEAGNAIHRQPCRIAYAIFDENIKNMVSAEPFSPFEELVMGSTLINRKAIEKDFERQADKGRVKISQRWEDVARWMNVAPAALKRTIDAYNSFCSAGHDADFVKDRRFLAALKTPPYYAVRFGTAVLTSHGGITINHRTEVIDLNGKSINGLYAAGIETAGHESDTYNMYLSGHSFGFSVSSGRIAGEQAARYALKK